MDLAAVLVGLVVYAALVGALAAGIYARFGHSEADMQAMGVRIGVDESGFARPVHEVRNAAARRAIELTIRQIQALAFEHGFLVPTELELRRMDRVRLGRELGIAEEKARRARAQAGVGRAAGVERVVGV